MILKKRETCRICGNRQLTDIVDLGDQYLQGSFVKDGYVTPPLRKVPTQLIRCNPQLNENSCGLVQLRHTVPTEVLYANYWYNSGTNHTMTNHLKDLVNSIQKIMDGDIKVALDVGCNDGTLLKNYKDGTSLYGVDPSDIAAKNSDFYRLINYLFCCYI